MRAAWLWAWADIRRRWVSLLLLGAVIALAVGSSLAVTGGARQAGTAFDRWAAATELPDVLINSGPEPTELLSVLASDPRISGVERTDMVVVAPAPMEPGPDGFMIVGAPDSMTGGFGRPPLVAGRYPDESSSDEIVVNERAAATYRFQSGQRVGLRTIGCFDGCPVESVGEATIVGVVRLPTDLIADPQTTGIAFASPAFLDGRWRELARPASWIGVHARARDDVDALVADLSVRVTDGDVASAWVTMAPLERAGRWQRHALVIAAAIVSLVGGLVVAQALNRHLGGRPNEPRVLAAVGVTRRERSAAGLTSILPAVIGGMVGGVFLTVVLSPLLPLGVVRRADPDVGLHADLVTIALGGVAALAIVIGVSSVVAARWAVLSRADVATSTPSIAARLAAAVGHRPVPETGIRFALARSQGRTRLPAVPTMFVLAGAVAVLVGALVVRWSLDGLVEHGDRYGQPHDLLVGLGDDDMGAQVRELAGDPRVQDLAISRQGAVNVVTGSGTTLQVNATGVESVTGPVPLTVLDGRVPVSRREIALATATMGTLALHTGDRTTVSGPCGEFEVEVVGRVIVPLTGSNFPDDGSVLTLDSFDELCAQDNVAGLDVNASALVRLHEHEATVPVGADWRARGLNVQDRQMPNSVGLVRELRSVPVLVGIFVAALGTAAVAHALVQLVRRRRHDLAVLRALGLRPREAGRIVRWAAITLALIALVVGVPLGLVVGRLVWTAIAASSNVVVRIDVSVLGIAALVAGIAAITTAAAIWPAYRATQHRPAADLGTE